MTPATLPKAVGAPFAHKLKITTKKVQSQKTDRDPIVFAKHPKHLSRKRLCRRSYSRSQQLATVCTAIAAASSRDGQPQGTKSAQHQLLF